MKKITTLLIFSFLYFHNLAKAQTVLAPGDMAFISYSLSGTDGFELLTFKELCPSTVIYFSDNPYRNIEGFCTSGEEFCLAMTVTATIPAGTKIRYREVGSPGELSIGAGSATLALVFVPQAGNNLGLSNSGDNLFAFQGSYLAPSFVCGIKMRGGSSWNSPPISCSNRQNTELPSTLTNGVNALYFNNSSSFNGGRYNSTLCSGTIAALRTAIHNSANWQNSNSLDVTCSFSLTDAVSGTCVVLDATILDFSVKTTENNLLISWQASDEKNTNAYQILHSSTALDWQVLAQRSAQKAEGVSTYTVQIPLSEAKTGYFQLVELESNDNLLTHGTRFWQNEQREDLLNIVSLYPQPAQDQVSIRFSQAIEGLVDYQIFSLEGKRIKASQTVLESPSEAFLLPSLHLSKGVYMVKIKVNDQFLQTRLIIE